MNTSAWRLPIVCVCVCVFSIYLSAAVMMLCDVGYKGECVWGKITAVWGVHSGTTERREARLQRHQIHFYCFQAIKSRGLMWCDVFLALNNSDCRETPGGCYLNTSASHRLQQPRCCCPDLLWAALCSTDFYDVLQQKSLWYIYSSALISCNGEVWTF